MVDGDVVEFRFSVRCPGGRGQEVAYRPSKKYRIESPKGSVEISQKVVFAYGIPCQDP